MEAETPLVNLLGAAGIGIIVLHKSGVRYSNQTGGCSCLHPEVEGIYVPLVDELVNQEKELEDFFTGPKWQGWCSVRIDTETADFIDAVLQKSPYTCNIRVDRSRLEASHEAWVYVTIPTISKSPEITELVGFSEGVAILTWSNSD